MKKTNISAIICAAGSGKRAGFDKNKLLAPLYGAPALYYTLKAFAINEIDEVIVAAAKKDFKEISALCAPFGYSVVRGGETRTQSVKLALESVTGDVVLIHDGARPFVSKQIISNCIESVKKFGSGVCAVKATDTVVNVGYGEICDRPDRDGVYLVQTPQGFLTEDIKNAYALAGNKVYTDDSAVYGEFIGNPRISEGDPTNIKLTYKSDFSRGIPAVPAAGGTVGFGVDAHAFGEGKRVTLGGVKIPCDRGLIAHSDGDVIAHAVTDALLSAAGLDDIGHYFPDTDEKFKDADSILLLKQALKAVNAKGFKVENISVSVQAEKPKLFPFIDAMKENLSAACLTKPENIAIAAGTCEGLGFVGEGLGICAYCIIKLTNI